LTKGHDLFITNSWFTESKDNTINAKTLDDLKDLGIINHYPRKKNDITTPFSLENHFRLRYYIKKTGE
jgi:hypothetical protein